jgi:hypothetical protein
MTNALYSTRTIPVEHVTISSTKPFEDVRAKLATSWRHVRRSPCSVGMTTGRC